MAAPRRAMESAVPENPTAGLAEAAGVDLAQWKRRIDDARSRRERFEQDWQVYARLHTNAYRAAKDKNDDANVDLPNGDQVKIGLVHRNIEQTMSLLEMNSISVSVSRKDITRATGQGDTHSEALVEKALQDSMLSGGGLMGFRNVADDVKRDGIMIGHGVVYTWWRFVQIEVPGDSVAEFQDLGDGRFAPVLDAAGQPVYAREMVKQTAYEAVQDDYVSPLEFLFEASAMKIMDARWHGREQITTLDALRKEGFEVPPDLKPSAYRRRTLYGEDPQTDEELEEDSVKRITIWDKQSFQLLHFLETCYASTRSRSKKSREGGVTELFFLRTESWPVRFDHPDKSPFEVFIPIPANDLPFGISQVEHIRNPAVEADKLRTRAANLTRQQKLLVLFRLGMVDQAAFQAAMKSPDSSVLGIAADPDMKWNDLMHVIKSEGVRPEILQQIEQAVDDVRETSGVSDVPLGGAETATESDRIYNIGSARVTRKRNFYTSFLARVAETHRCLLREFAPPGMTTMVPGLDGLPVPLQYGREAFVGKFSVTVIPGESGLSPIRQKFLSDMISQFTGKYGPQFDLALLRQALTLFDMKEVDALMRAARAGLALQFPQAFMPAGPGAPVPGGPPIPGQMPAPALQNLSNAGAMRSAMNAIVERPAGAKP